MIRLAGFRPASSQSEPARAVTGHTMACAARCPLFAALTVGPELAAPHHSQYIKYCFAPLPCICRLSAFLRCCAVPSEPLFSYVTRAYAVTPHKGGQKKGVCSAHSPCCSPYSCSSGMRDRHRGPNGHFVLPQLPVGQALRGRCPHARVPTLRNNLMESLNPSRPSCQLRAGSIQSFPYHSAETRRCQRPGEKSRLGPQGAAGRPRHTPLAP